MIDRDYCRMMARYNAWMNAKLYDGAAKLSDVQRREDRGAFFKSLHGTLHHVIWGDRVWMSRFKGLSPAGSNPDEGLAVSFEELRQTRTALDAEILDWADTLDDGWLRGDFRYYSVLYCREFVRPAWTLVTHLFNHQTHHRGQVTTLLMQFGIDPGVTDLPLLPGHFDPE